MKKLLFVMMLCCISIHLIAQPHWTAPSSSDYPERTVMNFAVNLNSTTLEASSNDQVEFAALINGEVRGYAVSCNSRYATTKMTYYTQMNVYGEDADKNADITIMAYINGIEYTLVGDQVSGLKFDGETHGTISNLPTFSVVDLSSLTLSLSDITVAKDATVDGGDYISFVSVTGQSFKYSELPAVPQYKGDIFTWSKSDYVSIEGNKIRGEKSTFADGASISVTFNVTEVSNKAKLFVTPFDKLDNSINVSLKPITIAKGVTFNLMDALVFVVDVNGKPEEKNYAQLAEYLGYEPTFAFSWSNEPQGEYYTKSEDNRSITGKRSTTPKGITAEITLTADNGTIYNNIGVVIYITPFHTPLESFSIDELQTYPMLVRFEESRFKITLIPDNATCNAEDFAVACDLSESGDWKLCDTRIVEETDGLYLYVKPLVASADMSIIVSFNAFDGIEPVSGNFGVLTDMPINKGWGWYTFYPMDDSNILDISAVNKLFFAGQLIDLRSQNENAYNDPDYGFFGSLTNIEAETCYKAKSEIANNAICDYTAALAPTEVDIFKGWNWIPYNYQYSHPFDEIAKMMPSNDGDMILSFADGFAEYNSATGWVTSLKSFDYGQGYLYYSTSSKEIVQYCTESELPQYVPEDPAHSKKRASYKKYNPSDWSDNMAVIANVEGIDDLDGLNVEAYVDGECRGEGTVVTAGEQKLVFITVHGKSSEKVTIRVTDKYGNQLSEQVLAFASKVGSLKAPLTLAGLSTSITNVNGVAVDNGVMYNLNGQRINTLQKGINIVNGKKVLK